MLHHAAWAPPAAMFSIRSSHTGADFEAGRTQLHRNGEAPLGLAWTFKRIRNRVLAAGAGINSFAPKTGGVSASRSARLFEIVPDRQIAPDRGPDPFKGLRQTTPARRGPHRGGREDVRAGAEGLS